MLRVLLTLLMVTIMPLAAQAAPHMQTTGYALNGSVLAPLGRLELVAGRNASIGPGEAARVARDAYGGRVLAVHVADGGAVYHVRLLIGGQVRVVLVDARNGRVLH